MATNTKFNQRLYMTKNAGTTAYFFPASVVD